MVKSKVGEFLLQIQYEVSGTRISRIITDTDLYNIASAEQIANIMDSDMMPIRIIFTFNPFSVDLNLQALIIQSLAFIGNGDNDFSDLRPDS